MKTTGATPWISVEDRRPEDEGRNMPLVALYYPTMRDRKGNLTQLQETTMGEVSSGSLISFHWKTDAVYTHWYEVTDPIAEAD